MEVAAVEAYAAEEYSKDATCGASNADTTDDTDGAYQDATDGASKNATEGTYEDATDGSFNETADDEFELDNYEYDSASKDAFDYDSDSASKAVLDSQSNNSAVDGNRTLSDGTTSLASDRL